MILLFASQSIESNFKLHLRTDCRLLTMLIKIHLPMGKCHSVELLLSPQNFEIGQYESFYEKPA